MTRRRDVLLGLGAVSVSLLAGTSPAALPVSPFPPLHSGARVLRQAEALAAQGNFIEALQLIEDWLAQGPQADLPERTFIEAFAAHCAVSAGRPEVARNHATLAGQLLDNGAYRERPDIQTGRLRLELGRIHTDLGEPAVAADHFAKAEAYLSVASAEEAAKAANQLGIAQTELQRFPAAVATLRRGLMLAEKAGLSHGPLPVHLWTNLAGALIEAHPLDNQVDAEKATRGAETAASDDPALLRIAQYARAQLLLHEPKLPQAEAMLEALVRGRDDDPVVGHALFLRATTRFDRGDMPEAVKDGFAALDAYALTLGTAHPAYGRVLHLLGTAHLELGDWPAAEAFFKRAADLFRRAFGNDAPQAHSTELERAALMVRVGLTERAVVDMRFALAEHTQAETRATLQSGGLTDAAEPRLDGAKALAESALAVFEANAPLQDRQQALAHVVLGLVAESRKSRQEDAALYHYEQAHTLLTRARGLNATDLGFSLLRRGRLLILQRDRRDEAVRLLHQAQDLYEMHGGAGTVRLAEVQTAWAELHFAHNEREKALEKTKEAFSTLRHRLDRTAPSTTNDGTHRRGMRELFAVQAWLLLTIAREDPVTREEAFAACQEALATSAGDAMRRTAVRIVRGQGPPARALEAREAAAEELRQIDVLLPRALERLSSDVGPAELRRLQARRAAAAGALDYAEEMLRQEYGGTAEFLAQRPVTLAQTCSTLGPDEAMLLLIACEKGAILWVLDQDGASTELLEDVPRVALAEMVASVRRELTAAYDLHRSNRAVRFFEGTSAREIFSKIIVRAEKTNRLKRDRTRHLLLVADGALQRLSPHLLQDSRKLWLAARYAVTTLPSVAARVVTRSAVRSAAPEPFLGVGDVSAHTAICSDSPTSLRQQLNCLEMLPTTKDELESHAKSLGAPPTALLLGKDATKVKLMERGPGRFRTLAFATHALMGGVSPWLPEPAIILSTTPDSDGQEAILTASEIATMRLDADLVLLSACNTAAPVAGAHIEGLSGLTRAFLHAGARCVLASHWPVASAAAADLTKAFVAAMQENSQLRPAEALRAAMLELERRPTFSHPFYWAPFVVVSA